MVLIFPTCFDHTLKHLSFVEKHVDLSGSLVLNQNIGFLQAELRFYRMFLWCFPDCDANLLADFNSIATSIAETYKIEEIEFALIRNYEYNSFAAEVVDKIRKCHAGINKYRHHLIASSLKAEPFTGNQTIKFLDSVHVFVNDILKYGVDKFPTLKSQIETLEEIVFLLRNLVYYTPMGGENHDDESFGCLRMFLLCFPLNDSDANPQTDLIFRFNVHDWANKAACFLILSWLTGKEDEETEIEHEDEMEDEETEIEDEDEMEAEETEIEDEDEMEDEETEIEHEENREEIRRLYIDLQQKVNPGNPDFIKLCFEVIKVPKMKRVDRILFGGFVSRFVDFFLENLINVRMIREGLIFLITFLADPPANALIQSELSSIREHIYAVLDQASVTICSFGETKMDLARGKTILDDFQKSIDEVRGKIENLYVDIPHSSWSNFPRIDKLGHFECLLEYLENLKESMKENKKLVPFLKHQIFTIQEELSPLRSFLQDTSTMQYENNGLKDIWEQIAGLLNQADFAIKCSFFIDDAIWYNLTCLSFVVRNVEAIRDKVRNIEFDTRTEGSQICRTESILPSMSSIDVPKPQTSTSIVEVVVGFKQQTELLLDRLEYGSAHLDIVSIVGMGGIGKTTLARKLYNARSIKNHFHKRAFCSVSQVYGKRNVLLCILHDLLPNDDEIRQRSDEDLQHRLYQCLKGNRYLIVVDDIWNISAWNDLRASLPDESNRSRVIFTTRINSISLIAKPDSTSCPLPFLSDDESWELLEQKIFRTDPCPPHLLNVGKLIAKNCKGLPLAIVVIAGLLAKTERSLLKWNEVANTLISFASSEGCKEIIELSYKQLPEALKSCFLYLGAFREDEIIVAKKLALLWVAEGFVLKSESSCLHKTAKKYLKDLGDMNLVTVTERSCNGGIKRCRVHDLIRDFCRTEAQEEHYMCYINAHSKNFLKSSVMYQYRISIEAEWGSFADTNRRGPTVHSLLFSSGSLYAYPKARFTVKSLKSVSQNFKLVHVLDLQEIIIDGEFPTTITTLVHLRYLALVFSEVFTVPPDISNLWNLETLVLSVYVYFLTLPFKVYIPNDIWEMKRLRHVEVYLMAYVALGGVTGDLPLLPDLRTFNGLYIPQGEDGEELLRRISNVQKFSCYCEGWWDPESQRNQLPKLEILTKLESLNMVHNGRGRPPYMFSFPSTIRKLTLHAFYLPWNEFSAIIEMLPCLEVLLLEHGSFSGERWNVVKMEGEGFQKIKSLTLYGLDIEEWNASSDSFPSLEKLKLSLCFKLIEIPPCFNEVVTLKHIEVHSCKKSVADSAIQIQKDQFDSGNESFEVDLHGTII